MLTQISGQLGYLIGFNVIAIYSLHRFISEERDRQHGKKSLFFCQRYLEGMDSSSRLDLLHFDSNQERLRINQVSIKAFIGLRHRNRWKCCTGKYAHVRCGLKAL